MNTEIPRATLEKIIRQLDPHAALIDAWQLTGGSSAHSTVCRIQIADNSSQNIIIRQPAAGKLFGTAQREFHILQQVQAMGIAAQAPLLLDESCQLLPTPYLVLSYVAGQPRYRLHDPVDCARQIATQLAKIHSVPLSGSDMTQLPAQLDYIGDRFTIRPNTFNATYHEAKIWETLAACWPVPQLSAPALLHGDFWPGNMLWRDGKLAAVIDWEDAQVGDPLTDVAITRFDLLFIFGRNSMQAFTNQYKTVTNCNFTHLPYWDLYAALRISRSVDTWIDGWAELGRPDITIDTFLACYHWFVSQALVACERLTQQSSN